MKSITIPNHCLFLRINPTTPYLREQIMEWFQELDIEYEFRWQWGASGEVVATLTIPEEVESWFRMKWT